MHNNIFYSSNLHWMGLLTAEKFGQVKIGLGGLYQQQMDVTATIGLGRAAEMV